MNAFLPPASKGPGGERAARRSSPGPFGQASRSGTTGGDDPPASNPAPRPSCHALENRFAISANVRGNREPQRGWRRRSVVEADFAKILGISGILGWRRERDSSSFAAVRERCAPPAASAGSHPAAEPSRRSSRVIKRERRRMAEREGFEPSVEFPLHTLSKRAPSASRSSLRLWNQQLTSGQNTLSQKLCKTS